MFTLFHVLISVIGIVSGLVVALAWMTSRHFPMWTSLFPATTVATSVTGFFFLFHGFKPSYVLGLLSLIVLAITYTARRKHCAKTFAASQSSLCTSMGLF